MGTDRDFILAYEGEDGIYHEIKDVAFVDLDTISEHDLQDPAIFGDLTQETFLIMCSLETRRLIGLEPLPRRLTRKRLIKLLMSYEVPRDFAARAVTVGVAELGSYAAVWRDIVLSQCRGLKGGCET